LSKLFHPNQIERIGRVKNTHVCSSRGGFDLDNDVRHIPGIMAETPERKTGITEQNSRFGGHWLGCLSWRDVLVLVKSTYSGWIQDKAPRLGASLAFYTLLSMAPMMIVVIAIASLAFGAQAAKGRLVSETQSLVGWQGAVVIQSLIGSTRGWGRGIVASAVGLGTLFFGATAVVNELRDALNTIWHAPPKPEQSYFRSFVGILRDRFLSFVVVLGAGLLLTMLLVISALLRAFGPYLSELLPAHSWMPEFYAIASFLIMTVLFAVVFKLLPDVKLEWSDVLIGAVFTSILFSIGRYLIGLYLGKTTIGSGYGAAGSLVIVLVWVYYSAQVFFFGAEFTAVYTRRYGSIFRRTLELRQTQPKAQVVTPESAPEHDLELVTAERQMK
jgi:membrane protein